MKVTAATLKKLVREAVEECYGGNMDEKKHEEASLEEQAKTGPEASTASAASPGADAMRAAFAGRSLAGGVAPSHMPGASAAGPEASAGSVRTTYSGEEGDGNVVRRESFNRLIKRLVSEALKEQGGPSWAPRSSVADTYVGGGAAPGEPEEMRRAVAAGYYDAAGNITPRGREYVSRRAAELQAQMVDAYRRTGRMPVEMSGTPRGGIAGLDASARRTAARRATAAIRGIGTETGAASTARREAGGTAALAARPGTDFNALISSLATGAPVPGSARPATTDARAADAARRARGVEAMNRVARERAAEFTRNRGTSGTPPAMASVPPVPSSPAVRPGSSPLDRSLDALASNPSGDPLEGIPPEERRLAEMVRKAVTKALQERKNKKSSKK